MIVVVVVICSDSGRRRRRRHCNENHKQTYIQTETLVEMKYIKNCNNLSTTFYITKTTPTFPR